MRLVNNGLKASRHPLPDTKDGEAGLSATHPAPVDMDINTNTYMHTGSDK